MKYIINSIRVVFFGLFIFLLINQKLMLWLVLFGTSLLLAVFFGRIYCGYVCPINTVMIPTDNIAKKFKFQSDKTPKWLQSSNFGWIALILSVVMFFLTRKILEKNFPILLVWLLIGVLTTLRYKTHVFHNLICPFGKLQQLFGQFATFSERVDKSACVGCKLCEKVCPNQSVIVDNESKKAEIDKELCLQCTNCQQICPVSAIAYKNIK